MTIIIEVYYNARAEFNNIDRYENYKFLIKYDKNIEVVREFVRIHNNYKINNLFIRRIENTEIIKTDILRIYIRI